MKQYNNRKEVPISQKWDLDHFFLDNNEAKKEVLALKPKLSKLAKQLEFTKTGKTLYSFLEDYFALQEEIISLLLYAMFKFDEDCADQDSLNLKGIIDNFVNEYEIKLAFVVPSLMALDKNKWKELKEENKSLQKYHNWLMRLQCQQKHSLSANDEELISRLTQTMSNEENICDMLLDSELYYGEINGEELTSTSYRKWLMNPDRKLRKQAYQQYYQTITRHKNTFANLYYGFLKNYNELTDIRHYKNSREAAIKSSNLNEKIIFQLVKATKANLAPYHRFLSLRKKVLEVDKLYAYDLTIPLATVKKEYEFNDAKKIIREALAILGEDYISVVDKAFAEKWIDYGFYKGKKYGAYCATGYSHHSQILTTYRNDLDSISTLIHELGHAVNAELSKKNEIFESSTDLFLVEIASLTNEFLLSAYMLDHSNDPEEKLAAIYNNLNLFTNNLFTCIYDTELEINMHDYINAGNAFTSSYLETQMKKYKKEIFGEQLILDDYSGFSWISRVHFFRPYYLFQYATSICIAASISQKILSHDEIFIKKYLNFLASGSKKWPLLLLKDLGISLETDQVYLDAINYFDHLLHQFEKIYNKKVN